MASESESKPLKKVFPPSEKNCLLSTGTASRIKPCLARTLKYIHTAHVFHRDLKPKNILANADCKLKICDFGLSRASFDDTPSAIFWTDYVATRWYRAPELCGSFFSKYTPAIDIWSIGCIFAEMLTGKPLFPGRNVVHQLDLVTDLLGSPSAETIARIRNDKARRYLNGLPNKTKVPFSHKFPNADPLALRLLERLLAFDPVDRISAEEISFSISRSLIYREILEYHPQMLQEYLHGEEHISFMYPSGIDRFKQQFADLEEQEGKEGRNSPLRRQYTSLPRERICVPIEEAVDEINDFERRTNAAIATTLRSPPRSERSKNVKKDSKNIPKSNKNASLSRSSSINNTPKYVGPSNRGCKETFEQGDEVSSVLSPKLAALSS
ncbi:hypothetical protein L2E82_43022 [Cichorium intybus]|uniref:Uncharacterized protein n=1 Tax=Cichorium intybus TaxID=13427 RepID=A0ACB8ZNF8_CICIN|nr:hypothetical protein L2E82_43022 [Cichorium intybus]